MIKIIKVLRGLKLIFLNSIYFNSKLTGLNLSILLMVNVFTKFIYLKNKNNNISNDFFRYTKKFKLSRNYFKHNSPIWFEIFKKNNFLKKKINILEIGSFEGMSLLFFKKYLKTKYIYSVDSIKNRNFMQNIKKINNIKFFHMTSNKFFKKKINIKFEIIYIDGSHYGLDVYNDLINADKFLNKNGILLIDDFLLDFSIRRGTYKFYEEVMGGVFMFLKKKNNYKFLYVGHQLILKKIQ